jgi:hypothetical protein
MKFITTCFRTQEPVSAHRNGGLVLCCFGYAPSCPGKTQKYSVGIIQVENLF